jgi:DNA-binding response OmpR family regulator
MTKVQITPPPRGAGHLILVVDDDPRIVELLHIALGAHGYHVITAANGEDALHLALQEQPDLVLLDVKLPRKSGYEVCQAIRREPILAHVPILMISALSDTEARLQGLQRGADDYLAKPFSPKELIAKTRRAIERSERFKTAERRVRELGGELERAREELRRTQQDRRREQRVREATQQLGQQLSRLTRSEEVSSNFLFSLMTHLGSQVAVLLEPRGDERGDLAPSLSRGLEPAQEEGLRFEAKGELAHILLALARPVRREELERFPEVRREMAPLYPAGIAVLVPVAAHGRLVALALLGDKAEPSPYGALDLEMAGSLAQSAGSALEQGLLVRRAQRAYGHALGLYLTAAGERHPRAAVLASGVRRVTEALAREIGFPSESARRLGLEAGAVVFQEDSGESWEGVAGITPLTESGLEYDVAQVARDFLELAPRLEIGTGPRQVVAQLRGDRQVLEALEDLLVRGELVPSDLAASGAPPPGPPA